MIIFADMQPKNPNFKALVAEKFERNSFSHVMGVKLQKVEHGLVECFLPLTQELTQQNNIAHGGVLMTLSDIVAGFAAFTVVPPEYHVVTAEIKVSCLRPGDGDLFAKGLVLKPGKKIIFCESEIYTGGFNQKLVAKSSSAMAVVDSKTYAR